MSWLDLPLAVSRPWTGVYLRALAAILVFGAAVHVGNMLGWSEVPWRDTPMLWRGMDIVLLVFNLVVAAGLWRRQPWGVIGLVGGVIVLQVIPYTLFRTQFVRGPSDAATLNGLLGTWGVLLGILALLVLARR